MPLTSYVCMCVMEKRDIGTVEGWAMRKTVLVCVCVCGRERVSLSLYVSVCCCAYSLGVASL